MSWLPAALPQRVDVGEITFVPLTPTLLCADYAAVMRDIPMLRQWCGQDWPTLDFSLAENLADLERHGREQLDGVALTYSVFCEDVLIGCVYVRRIQDALQTRDVVLADPALLPSGDVAVRGWAHEIEAATLIAATLTFLQSAPFAFPRVWWQTNVECVAQLGACDEVGLTQQLSFGGPTTTWILASRP